MAKRPRTEASIEAEARYRESREQVLIRLTKDEAKAVDAVRGDTSRGEWMKQRSLAAAMTVAKRKGRA